MNATKSTAKAASKFPEVIKADPVKRAPRKAAAKEVAAPVVEVTEEQRHGERRAAQEQAAAKFATGNMTTPAAHPVALSPEQQKKAEYDAAIAKLAADFGQPLPPAVKAGRAKQLAQNGITRPAVGTTTGNVWAAADAISAGQGGHPATIAQVKDCKEMHNVNQHTIKTQYARWRSFNGIKGRIVIVKPVVQEGAYDALEQK